MLNESFHIWINYLPNRLFNADIYAAYKKIKDIDSIRVVNERSLFEVEMLDFEKKLTKSPEKENDSLPRYIKIALALRTNGSIKFISQWTIKFLGVGVLSVKTILSI